MTQLADIPVFDLGDFTPDTACEKFQQVARNCNSEDAAEDACLSSRVVFLTFLPLSDAVEYRAKLKDLFAEAIINVGTLIENEKGDLELLNHYKRNLMVRDKMFDILFENGRGIASKVMKASVQQDRFDLPLYWDIQTKSFIEPD